METGMGLRIRPFLLAVLVTLAVAGCYTTPVRHLASDVAMIKVGQSTTEEVLIYLGDPDERRQLGGGEEVWVFEDERRTLLEKAPVVGKYVGQPEYHQVVVTLVNGIVTGTEYRTVDEDDMDWAKDFPWQKKP
jgi:hypothetical protein